MSSQTHLLAANALILMSFSSLFGGWLLHRVHLRGSRSGVRDLVAAHVDWIMLSLVEVALSYAMTLIGENDVGAATLLVLFGGWLNPVPYLARGLGVNAFAFSGTATQQTLAVVSGLSALALTSDCCGPRASS